MILAKHDHIIEALILHRLHPAYRVSIPLRYEMHVIQTIAMERFG